MRRGRARPGRAPRAACRCPWPRAIRRRRAGRRRRRWRRRRELGWAEAVGDDAAHAVARADKRVEAAGDIGAFEQEHVGRAAPARARPACRARCSGGSGAIVEAAAVRRIGADRRARIGRRRSGARRGRPSSRGRGSTSGAARRTKAAKRANATKSLPARIAMDRRHLDAERQAAGDARQRRLDPRTTAVRSRRTCRRHGRARSVRRRDRRHGETGRRAGRERRERCEVSTLATRTTPSLNSMGMMAFW